MNSKTTEAYKTSNLKRSPSIASIPIACYMTHNNIYKNGSWYRELLGQTLDPLSLALNWIISSSKNFFQQSSPRNRIAQYIRNMPSS